MEGNISTILLHKISLHVFRSGWWTTWLITTYCCFYLGSCQMETVNPLCKMTAVMTEEMARKEQVKRFQVPFNNLNECRKVSRSLSSLWCRLSRHSNPCLGWLCHPWCQNTLVGITTLLNKCQDLMELLVKKELVEWQRRQQKACIGAPDSVCLKQLEKWWVLQLWVSEWVSVCPALTHSLSMTVYRQINAVFLKFRQTKVQYAICTVWKCNTKRNNKIFSSYSYENCVCFTVFTFVCCQVSCHNAWSSFDGNWSRRTSQSAKCKCELSVSRYIWKNTYSSIKTF